MTVDMAGRATPFRTILGGDPKDTGDLWGRVPDSTWKPFHDVGISVLRTHDIRELDWDRIFPDWKADENAAASYKFVEGDRILRGMIAAGFTPMRCLGPSYQPTGIGRNPPDIRKWARIADRIVAHYVDGWDDGFRYPLRYIEIWNEPDGTEFWSGGPKKFQQQCLSSLRLLKKDFPDVKVGGCGVASIDSADYTASLVSFLAHPGDGRGRAPLDFFSWHDYDYHVRGLPGNRLNPQ